MRFHNVSLQAVLLLLLPLAWPLPLRVAVRPLSLAVPPPSSTSSFAAGISMTNVLISISSPAMVSFNPP